MTNNRTEHVPGSFPGEGPPDSSGTSLPGAPTFPGSGLLEMASAEQQRELHLSDSSTQKRLSPAAIEAILNISEKWQLKNEQVKGLLGGISDSRYCELKGTSPGVLTQDELTRVSLLIGIFKALNILFNEKLANEWVSRPNLNPMFHKDPPVKFLIEGGIPGMWAVRRLLDSRVVGN